MLVIDLVCTTLLSSMLYRTVRDPAMQHEYDIIRYGIIHFHF